jgi:hypothetical protein
VIKYEITHILGYDGVNSTNLVQWAVEVSFIGASSYRLGLGTSLFPLLNPRVLPYSGIPNEVIRNEEESPKLILFNPTEMTMGLPCLPLYLHQCMSSLQHLCTMLMLPHSISRIL